MSNQSKKAYGIDLGTTYSAIAVLDEHGMPQLIRNEDGNSELLPSAVFFPEDGDPVVGEEAKKEFQVAPDRVVQMVKTKIGHSKEEYQFNGKIYNPITISALILKQIKTYADKQGHEVKDVVITVPAYFGNEEKAATKQAGIIAGFNVLGIVHEPVAAALNYANKKFMENQKILVYDLGGGTFDITLFEFRVDGGRRVANEIGTSGNRDLGGKDWDKLLFDYCLERYVKESNTKMDDVDIDILARMRLEIESIKKSLSNKPSHTYRVGKIPLKITKDEFEDLTKSLVAQTMALVDKLFADVGMTKNQVDLVLLVGGSTLMPMIQNAVNGAFPNSKVILEEPAFAVAKGAALAAKEADIKNSGGKLPDEMVVPDYKLSRSVGVAAVVGDKLMITNILFTGESMTKEAVRNFSTRADNQQEIKIRVFENISKDEYVTPPVDIQGNPQDVDAALEVKLIAEATMTLPHNTPKGTPVEVFMCTGTSGLKVRATLLGPTGTSIDMPNITLTSGNTFKPDELKDATELVANTKTTGDW